MNLSVANSKARRYWPYDELRLHVDRERSQVELRAPWLVTTIRIDSSHLTHASHLAEKINAGLLGPEDIDLFSNFIFKLRHHPYAYVLPEVSSRESSLDTHRPGLLSVQQFSSARDLLLRLAENHQHAECMRNLAASLQLPPTWKWDHEAVRQFAESAAGLDPISIFSVCRRFHLLDSVEFNQTNTLTAFVQSLKDNQGTFKLASSIIVRQNHYVTAKCLYALSPARAIAQSAEDSVTDFIMAEYGHDIILGKALSSLGASAVTSPLCDATVVLMDLLHYLASKNFLAFALAVDMFERSSYQAHDPLANLLTSGGESAAARQIDHHKDINDQGEHENVAMGLIARMAPVSTEYAREALVLAESLSDVMHLVSLQTLELIKARLQSQAPPVSNQNVEPDSPPTDLLF